MNGIVIAQLLRKKILPDRKQNHECTYVLKIYNTCGPSGPIGVSRGPQGTRAWKWADKKIQTRTLTGMCHTIPLYRCCIFNDEITN